MSSSTSRLVSAICLFVTSCSPPDPITTTENREPRYPLQSQHLHQDYRLRTNTGSRNLLELDSDYVLSPNLRGLACPPSKTGLTPENNSAIELKRVLGPGSRSLLSCEARRLTSSVDLVIQVPGRDPFDVHPHCPQANGAAVSRPGTSRTLKILGQHLLSFSFADYRPEPSSAQRNVRASALSRYSSTLGCVARAWIAYVHRTATRSRNNDLLELDSRIVLSPHPSSARHPPQDRTELFL